MADFKICGLTNREDAEVAAEAGARYIGAIMVPSSQRRIDSAAARALAVGLEPDLVLVVANEAPDVAATWAREAGAAVIQLHGEESPAYVDRIRALGDWRIWKAVRARNPESVMGAVRRFAGVVDGTLVDGWHPARIGGTGALADWRNLTGLRDGMGPGLFVAAGGLTPENVAGVVAQVRPDVVDVSSGVERAPGLKDPAKVRQFARAVAGGPAARSTADPERR